MTELRQAEAVSDLWRRPLELAWEGFRTGTSPIGAVVLDADGVVVAEARSRRRDEGAPSRQLFGCRIAHAEVNALALLDNDGYYSHHTLYTTVEPCCLCMGAAIQTGVGAVRFAWADSYAGAAAMVVPNPQVSLKAVRVEGPAGGLVEWLAGLLLTAHFVIDGPNKPHVTAPMQAAYPHLFEYSDRSDVRAALDTMRRSDCSIDELLQGLP